MPRKTRRPVEPCWVWSAVARGLSPPRRLRLSEWAEENYRLSSETSAQEGAFQPHPFQVGILDALTDPTIERVSVLKGARVGWTTMVKCLLAYHIAQEPCPIMYVLPTLDDCEAFSKQEISPMIRDVELLHGKVADAKSRDSGNTLRLKNFTGGFLQLVGANAPTGFRRVAIRVLVFDEADGYPDSAGTEGDPIELAERRTQTFWNRKILMGTTPKVKGFSKIETAFGEGDQRYYFVPCPLCGHRQVLRFNADRKSPGGIRWEKDKPETAWYECEECKKKIPHKKKAWMVERGEWRATNPEAKKKHASFHIWAGYSLDQNASWALIAEKFLKAKEHPDTLQTFVNTWLGELWEPDLGEKIDAGGLYSRREEYGTEPIPEGVLLVTAAVDVQEDRTEVELRGWGVGEESWGLEKIVFWGDPGLLTFWHETLNPLLLTKQYTRPDGVILNVAGIGVDTGGRHTQTSYDWIRPLQGRRVYALKGSNRPGRPIVERATRSKGITLHWVGTDTAKDLIYSRLKLHQPGPGCVHFPESYTPDYFEQLVAERVAVRYTQGYARRVYTKKQSARNEALDLLVYNLAVLRILGPDYQAMRRGIAAAAARKQEQAGGAQARRPVPRNAPGAGRQGRGRGGWAKNW